LAKCTRSKNKKTSDNYFGDQGSASHPPLPSKKHIFPATFFQAFYDFSKTFHGQRHQEKTKHLQENAKNISTKKTQILMLLICSGGGAPPPHPENNQKHNENKVFQIGWGMQSINKICKKQRAGNWG